MKNVTNQLLPKHASNVVSAESDFKDLSHLCNLEFPTQPGAIVSLLIGTNTPETFCLRDTHVGAKGQPIAVETPLGWSLLRPSLSLTLNNKCHVNFTRVDSALQRQIDSLWETNFGNSTLVLDTPSSREDRVVFDLMQISVKRVEGHYSLPLP